MKKIEIKGIWIPSEILFDKELNDKEKILLSIIVSLSTELGFCFASNRYLSNILNVTINRVSKIMSSLCNKGYIDIKLIYKESSKEIKKREIKIKNTTLIGIVKNNNTYGLMEQEGIVSKGKDIINIYNKYYNNKKEFEKNSYSKEDLENLYENLD